MVISDEIVSFPHHTRFQDHAEALPLAGKPFYIAPNAVAYLGRVATASEFQPPELIICDYSEMAILAAFAYREDKLAFVSAASTVIIGGEYWPPESSEKCLNVIGFFDITDQWHPNKFSDLITAFYQAKLEGTVTPENFAKARGLKPDPARPGRLIRPDRRHEEQCSS